MGAQAAGSISVIAIASAIFVACVGAMYASTAEGSVGLDAMYIAASQALEEVVEEATGETPQRPLRIVSVTTPEPPRSEPLPPEVVPMPTGADATEEAALIVDAQREIIDEDTGVRLGAVSFEPLPEPIEAVEPELVTPRAPERSAASRRASPRPSPRRAARDPVPRLHPNPGMHVILTARGMNARGERIQGSCYTYLSEVFERAGHGGWRTRRVVYQGNRNGPYADLSLVRPGDWLYIVNHPNRTPVGTHSVLFVGWEDRARGYARVIEHSGWGAARTGQERGYDISRTYRITRPTMGRGQ